jgi:protein-L-isoaspartate(D-aspartate) O-methyltransferase
MNFAAARRNMIDTQLRTYDVNNLSLLAAFESVAREAFVPAALTSLAYTDQKMTVIGSGGERRDLLSPMVLARMIQALEINAGVTVLDVAAGSGYSSAIMAASGGSVTLLEDSEGLAAAARSSLKAAEITGVEVTTGPLAEGATQAAPFDVILVNGSVQQEPGKLLAQLKDGGRLAVIMGAGRSGKATVFTRSRDAIGRRAIIEASATALDAFKPAPAFVF